MSKIAIVTDSNSGITQDQAKEIGIRVLPMPFMIDGETYYEEITLSQAEFYQKLAQNADISTSQPSPESITQLWDSLLEDNDEIVHIPMSSGLSGSCQTAVMLAQDYDGRVHVVNNQRISVTQKQSVFDALELVKEGKSGGEIRDILEADKFNSSIYIMIDTLYYLKKGGRITPAAVKAGSPDPGRETRCIRQSKDSDTGKIHHDQCDQERYREALWRSHTGQSDLSGARTHAERGSCEGI